MLRILDMGLSCFLLRGEDVHISRASDAGRGIPAYAGMT